MTLVGGKSLLRQSVDRLKGLVRPEDVYVVTDGKLAAATARELPEIPRRNILGEPCRRDTAAAVALGTACAGEGLVGVFPSDQLVTKPGAFRQAVRRAVRLATGGESIVTLGIRPTTASAQFGYIDPQTGKFVEKPDPKRARRYVEKGFLWNAGIFIAEYGTFRSAFGLAAPEFLPLFEASRDFEKRYSGLPKISFDYAVMENYPSIKTVAVDCGWDDVGSYLALEKHCPALVDENGNLIVSRAQPIRVLGVENLIVAATPDGVLVADKRMAGELKRLFG